MTDPDLDPGHMAGGGREKRKGKAMKKFGRRTTDSDTYHHIHHKCRSIASRQPSLG